jgi:uncharacterized protein
MPDQNLPYSFSFLEQDLLLLPEKALLWKNTKTLLISDIHLGKAAHFRKSGVPIPAILHYNDLLQIDKLIKRHHICKIIFLGDLFHSRHNGEWELFECWVSKNHDIEFHLVRGNHDILPNHFYINSPIKVHNEYLVEKPFIFTHIPISKPRLEDDLYNISGHIHPSVRLYGKARQSLSLPCFYFGRTQAIMPAFGVFTGKYDINPDDSCKIFAIANNKIISILN